VGERDIGWQAFFHRPRRVFKSSADALRKTGQ
jgi:hypothetical protein